jgi:hypothetical protein
VAAECGYNTSRGLGDIVSPGGCGDCAYSESMPPAEPQYLKAPAQVDSSWTLDQMKAVVTNAVDREGGWVILTFHRICAPIDSANCAASVSTTPTLFDAFASWLASFRDNPANNTVVQTIDQTVRQYMGSDYPGYQPAQAVAPRPAAPFGVNALINPSLETTEPPTSTPFCWRLGNWGRNTTESAIASPGRSGNIAQHVRITEYTDGDAKLLPSPDIHTCSPTVEPGKTYKLSVWYQSTGATQFAVFYRDRSYNWINWKSSPEIAPTASPTTPTASPTTWTEASYNTPPVPADGTAMTFGLALVSEGTLTTDDYGLIETREPAAAGAEPASLGDGGTPFWRSPVAWMLGAALALQSTLYFRRSPAH